MKKQLAPSIKFQASFSGYKQLDEYLKRYLSSDENYHVHAGMEATGAYWLSLYEYLVKRNIHVTVLNPIQVKAYRNEGIRGAKTDKIDALLIVRVLRFGDCRPSSIPSEDLFALRQLTRLRSDLVAITSELKAKT